MTSLHSHSREETMQCGRVFASTLRGGDVVALSGELGAGKTHFIAGVCEGLGVKAHVASPTFTIINEYPAAVATVVHVDLYRISSRGELFELGIEEYFNERCICLIEWAERMRDFLPYPHIHVTLTYGKGDNDRNILIDEMRKGVERAGGIAV